MSVSTSNIHLNWNWKQHTYNDRQLQMTDMDANVGAGDDDDNFPCVRVYDAIVSANGLEHPRNEANPSFSTLNFRFFISRLLFAQRTLYTLAVWQKVRMMPYLTVISNDFVFC